MVSFHEGMPLAYLSLSQIVPTLHGYHSLSICTNRQVIGSALLTIGYAVSPLKFT